MSVSGRLLAIQSDALRILGHHRVWPGVVRVAAALMAHGFLLGTRVESILNGAKVPHARTAEHRLGGKLGGRVAPLVPDS